MKAGGKWHHSVKTDKWAKRAIEPFDQKLLEVRALLNLKVACLLEISVAIAFYMYIKEKINGTTYWCEWWRWCCKWACNKNPFQDNKALRVGG